MRRPELPITLLALSLTGCVGEAAQPIQPGEWEVTRTTGAPNGRQTAGPPTKICFRGSSQDEDASRQMVLDLIDNNRCEAGQVAVSGGRISGALQCPEFYGFSAHEEPVSGRYSPTAVTVNVDMPIMGQTLRQGATAKRIGDC